MKGNLISSLNRKLRNHPKLKKRSNKQIEKKEKKQEPIFSALEEIKIEKTKKTLFEQTIIPCEIKGPEEKTTTFLQPEAIPVASTEPPEPLLSATVAPLTVEQGTAAPAVEETELIVVSPPPVPEPATVVVPGPSAENLSGPFGALPGEEGAVPTTPSLPEFSFVLIFPGSFIMGSPETESGRGEDELPHEVSIAHGFSIQTTPVTQGQWKAVMGTNPSRFASQGDDCPVESVSWYDCRKFIEQLNRSGEHKYRLPTEAEWEYACRAGKISSCSEGEVAELFCEYDSNLDAAGWYGGNSERVTHPVARKKPNSWGLYDMHGNVLEWCQDWYGPYPVTPQTDPSGPVTGLGRVIRGGSWFSNAKSCRSAARFYWSPNAKSDFIGFRLVKADKKI